MMPGPGRTGAGWRRAMQLAGCGLAALAAAGCAPKQVIPLDVSPPPSEVYLDKQPLDGAPRELELRADRDHTLFFKKPGYRPELVVLESLEVDGEERLVPERVELRLRPLASGTQQIEVELEGE